MTRYFGGDPPWNRRFDSCLFPGGAGGACRAAEVITRIPGVKLKLTAEYTELGKIQYLLGEKGLTAQDAIYTEKVELTVLVPEADAVGIRESLTRRD